MSPEKFRDVRETGPCWSGETEAAIKTGGTGKSNETKVGAANRRSCFKISRISPSTLSTILITWVKLMSNKLHVK